MQLLTLVRHCLWIGLILGNLPVFSQITILPSNNRSLNYGISNTYSSTPTQPIRSYSTATVNKPYGISPSYSHSSSIISQPIRRHHTSSVNSSAKVGISESYSYSPHSSQRVRVSQPARYVSNSSASFRRVPATTNKNVSYGVSNTIYSYKNGQKRVISSKAVVAKKMVDIDSYEKYSRPEQAPLTLPNFTEKMVATPIPTRSKPVGAYNYATLVGSAAPSAVDLFEGEIKDIYYSADLGEHGLEYTIFKHALTGYYNLMNEGHYDPNKSVITIIDYKKPSDEKRFYIVDVVAKKLLYKTWVSHGKNSGGLMARYFSDTPQSHQTSLGFYRTAEPYKGRFGYSMKLDGLEYGFNRNARKRSIVMHSDPSITPAYTKLIGMLMRSFGCPSIPVENHKDIINLIKNGTCLFMYYDDLNYLNNSSYLNINSAANYYNGRSTGYGW